MKQEKQKNGKKLMAWQGLLVPIASWLFAITREREKSINWWLDLIAAKSVVDWVYDPWVEHEMKSDDMVYTRNNTWFNKLNYFLS